MAIKESTGLRDYMLVTGSLASALAGSEIRVFAGAEPASADAAETGTLLTTLTINSTGVGLAMDTVATSGFLSKPSAAIWSGLNGAGGVATHYRHVVQGDTGGVSTTDRRIQGSIAMSGADMNLANTTLVGGNTQSLQSYVIQLPTA